MISKVNNFSYNLNINYALRITILTNSKIMNISLDIEKELKVNSEEIKQAAPSEEKKYPTINAVFRNNISTNGAGYPQTANTEMNKSVILPRLNNIMDSNFTNEQKQKDVESQIDIKQEASSPSKCKQGGCSVGPKTGNENMIPCKQLPIPVTNNLEPFLPSLGKCKDKPRETANNLFKDFNQKPKMPQPNNMGYSKRQATILNHIKEERLSQINSK